MNIVERDNSGWGKLPATWPECLRKVLAARGIQQEEDLVYSLVDLPKPDLLMGMQDAVALLYRALQNDWHIKVVADFDSDGATSCAMMIRGLKMMGLSQLSFIVPNRFVHGYGLTPELLDEIDYQQQPDMLLTVDNGISSIAGVDVAKQRGMKVLVTDHHLPAEALPKADAIVNPNQQGDQFPSKSLAGVGVGFYVLLGLRQYCRQQGWFQQRAIAEPKITELLDLVALGTVADVVPLDKLNRTLVNMGIMRIRNNLACAGINALIQVAGKNRQALISSDIGFGVAPRINAAGRMEDMSLGIQTLLTDDQQQAVTNAQLLDQINQERRAVEADMQQDAIEKLARQFNDTQDKPLAYCLFDQDWHQGVVGLLASRIKEKQHRPVIVFAPSENGEIKGSARSIAGVHIRDVLARVAAIKPQLLSKFGGHAMAAGLTLKRQDLNEFEDCLLSVLRQQVSDDLLVQYYQTDGELAASDLSLQLAETLNNAAPWGQAFPAPQFHGDFHITQFRHVGAEQNHLRLSLQLDNGEVVTAMAFNQIAPSWLEQGGTARLCYRLDVNTFRDEKSVQLIVEYIQAID
jgi:single-stranded-DNA-specific exonuclease